MAHFGEPLFSEPVSAWDVGPVVGQLWHAERDGEFPSEGAVLNGAELNTIGWVVSRYGALTGVDLEHLTHAEDPWLLADRDRPPGGSVRIEREWMRDYFRAMAGDHEDGEVWFSSEAIARITAGAAERHAAAGPPGPDETDRLRGRLRALERRLAGG